jgi:hypothetical protein
MARAFYTIVFQRLNSIAISPVMAVATSDGGLPVEANP